MRTKKLSPKIVIVNQATNYLTIGFANAFRERFNDVSLITGSIHVQGEELDKSIAVDFINKYVERPAAKKMLSYLQACFRIFWLLKTKYRKHEVFFVSLPPMGYLLNLLVGNKFSMVIWDVYTDTFQITWVKKDYLFYRSWAYLNKRSFKKAYKLFTIGEKMSELIEQYVDKDKILIQPIWSIFQKNQTIQPDKNPFIKSHCLEGKFVIQYSGNIGLTHKVELMVKIAALLKDEESIVFQIIGRGPRVPFIKNMIEELNLPNCKFFPFQSDEIFPYSLAAANIGVVILDGATAKGSVPSKSYNLMSYGIPSLYIASADSELNNYAIKFGHGKCYDETELELARDFILELYKSTDQWKHYSDNALMAAANFKRDNADKFVAKYISE